MAWSLGHLRRRFGPGVSTLSFNRALGEARLGGKLNGRPILSMMAGQPQGAVGFQSIGTVSQPTATTTTSTQATKQSHSDDVDDIAFDSSHLNVGSEFGAETPTVMITKPSLNSSGFVTTFSIPGPPPSVLSPDPSVLVSKPIEGWYVIDPGEEGEPDVELTEDVPADIFIPKPMKAFRSISFRPRKKPMGAMPNETQNQEP